MNGIIKFDSIQYHHNNNLLGYLYLWNKTFLNTHLIKQGVADVDISIDYRYKSKFLKEREQSIIQGMDSPSGYEKQPLICGDE
ncbi:MAG: thermonuclease family protein [Atribacterota bacterium]